MKQMSATDMGQGMRSFGKAKGSFWKSAGQFFLDSGILSSEDAKAAKEAFYAKINEGDFSSFPKTVTNRKTGKKGMKLRKDDGTIKWASWDETFPATRAVGDALNYLYRWAEIHEKGMEGVLEDAYEKGELISDTRLRDLSKPPVDPDKKPKEKETYMEAIRRGADLMCKAVKEAGPEDKAELEAILDRVYGAMSMKILEKKAA